MRFRATEIAAVTSGVLHGDDAEVVGATQDSRELQPGQLFIPVVAERDGHEFIAGALENGAAAYLTQQDPVAHGWGGSAILVDDTVAALQALGRHARSRLGEATVVGITGSAGKTSTKDLLASILRQAGPTHASDKSFNNEMGVPLTIVNAPDGTAALVVEMGMRGLGQITELCAIAAPTIGIVTTVGVAHTSELGSVEAVVQAKGELVEALPAGGHAVLNADVPEVAGMASRTAARVITFGCEAGDVRASHIVLADDLTSMFRLDSPWGSAEIALGARGEHNVANACAAAAAALASGVGMTSVVAGLLRPDLSPWRMELHTTASGARLVNDAYNANPLSMAAALRSVAALAADRRVAVVGLMGELGDDEAAEHARVVQLAGELGIELLAVADAPYPDVPRVDELSDVPAALGELGAGDVVLIKGSRSTGLEALVELLR